MTSRLTFLSHLLFVGVLCADTANAAQQCLKYEPAVVSLSGKLVQKTFPGPPNFESVENGDRAETRYHLQLDPSICTRAAKDDDAGDHDGVSELQLVLSGPQYDAQRPKLGARVTLSGSLFEAHSGHHHTPVLLMVREKQ
ncbi:DUF4431 domain-containing protein [Niveibacterium sp.]|uniref:DUF4431 domain-containing protein n=1 Tax=Niveibacterium sp. TaxID=2017444 RepID=UPI0035AD86B9